MAVAIEFLDLQLQMGDQRLVVGLLSAGGRTIRSFSSSDQHRRRPVSTTSSRSS
ncbi:hypothetical protein ACVWXQ_000133 [Bradyrhizobium sp. S3.14.4]